MSTVDKVTPPVSSEAHGTTAVRLEIHQLSEAVGAEIRGLDLSSPLDDATIGAVKAAWAKHLVLLFRDQKLADRELLAFSRNFGDLDKPHPSPFSNEPFVKEFPEIMVISNVVESGVPIGNLGDGEAVWHTYMSYAEEPPIGSILHSLEIPADGGDTSFTNMYLAYQMLPDDLKRQVEGRRAIHDNSLNSAGMLRKEYTAVTDPRETPGARHPIVRSHPVTGRQCLFLGRRTNGYVLGLEVDQSEDLLDKLWAHSARPEFVWRHRWRVGDVLMWDNRCVMHRREAFPTESRRIMHRTQISGRGQKVF